MVKKFSRRAVLGTSAAMVASASFATPALSLSKSYIDDRGDLRFGLLADYPPYVFLRAGSAKAGILSTIGKILAAELWLSPSYANIKPEQYLGAPLESLFDLYGGLDVLLHVPLDLAIQENALHTVDYIEDNISYICLPDLREIGLFPATFRTKNTLSFADQMIHRDIMGSRDLHQLDISFDVSVTDLLSKVPLERLLDNEFGCFMASRRQLEWMNGDSIHKFHVNDVFNYGKSTRQKFCAVVNPRSAWILEHLENRLQKLRASYDLQLLYNKYNLILTI